MCAFRLVVPDVAYKESFLAGLRELRAEGLSWYLALDPAKLAADFQAYVDELNSPGHLHPRHLVRETKRWGLWQGEFAGVISIRHELTDGLRAVGGHIGYDTRPRLRGRGIASLMLGEALPIARRLGLKEVLLTCDDTNAASIRVIEKNGGILEATRRLAPGGPMKRYYRISL